MGKLSNLEFFKLVAGNGDAGSAESRFIYPPAIARTLGFRLLEFSALSGIHPMIEKYPLDQVAEAYEQMHSGRVRFRVVLTMGD